MEQELYHIHKKNNKDRQFEVNNIIKVKNDFKSTMAERHMDFSQMIEAPIFGEICTINFDMYLAGYLDKINNMKIIKGSDLEELKCLIQKAYQMSFNANFFKREQALETCRLMHKPELPSRLHSMYLCDEDGLEYWKDTISNKDYDKIEVYRVLADGNIFKSNEQLLPNEILTYESAINESFKYWNPKFKNVSSESNEYLVQGNVKILERKK